MCCFQFESDDTEQPFVTASFQVTSGLKEFPLGNPSNIKGKCTILNQKGKSNNLNIKGKP